MEFCILSFGGEFFYDQNNFDSDIYKNNTFTHIILDREMKGDFPKNVEIVQPQWIIDSINNGKLLDCADYVPGKTLPPHLSPFVDNKKEGFVPKRQQEID